MVALQSTVNPLRIGITTSIRERRTVEVVFPGSGAEVAAYLYSVSEHGSMEEVSAGVLEATGRTYGMLWRVRITLV